MVCSAQSSDTGAHVLGRTEGVTQDAQIFCSTRREVVVVGSLLRGMSITVVMPPAAAALVAVSMPAWHYIRC